MLLKQPIPKAIIGASRQHHHCSSLLLSIACRNHSSRAYATAVGTKTSTPSVPFTVSELGPIKVASRDDGGATTGLTVVLRAGSRYSESPGLAHYLEKFAWKNTYKRTAFRVTRETELLGGLLASSSSRETVSVTANCLREDIPYFVEALADVAIHTKYTEYEFHDDVLKLAQYDYDALQVNPTAVALDALHSAAFHRGLGNPLLALPTHPTHHHEVEEYAAQTYTKANLVLVASGATTDELKPQIEEFWKDLPAGKALTSPASKFVGGETRIPHADALQVYAIGFPGSALYGPNASPEHVILAHFLGGVAPIKWSHGQSPLSKLTGSISSPDASGQVFATNISYSDAGIFTLFTSGSVDYVTKAASGAVKLLQDVAKGSQAIKPEDVKRAIASGRYATYAASEARLSGLEPIGQAILDTGNVVDLDTVVSSFDKVTPEKLKQTAAKLLETKPAVVAVGYTHKLPFYDEL